MKKEHKGVAYRQVADKIKGRCAFCVAKPCTPLCVSLAGVDDCKDKIWEVDVSEKKTALELIDDLMWDALEGSDEWIARKEVKSAIEREQGADNPEIGEIKFQLAKAILQIRQLESAIEWKQKIAHKKSMVIHALKHELEQANHIIENMQVALGTLKESAITMRPISELPDRVPDGCVIAQVNGRELSGWFVDELYRKQLATGFYIIPLPLPRAERKLHPCYMPGCGGDAKCYAEEFEDNIIRENSSNEIVWQVDCVKCGASGPAKATKEQAEEAWGWDKGEL